MGKNIGDKIPSFKISEIKSVGVKKTDFEMFRFEDFIKDVDHLKVPHRHDHFALFFITKGRGSHIIDFKEFELRANRIFFLSPGQIHSWKTVINSQGFVMLFTSDFFSVSNNNRDLRDFLFFNPKSPVPYLDLNKLSFENVVHLFRSIEEKYKGNKSFRFNIIRSYLSILFFELVRIYEHSLAFIQNQSIAYNKVTEFEKLVNRHFKTHHSVSDFAEMLHITPNYLNAICSKYKGNSAGEIIRERILLEAKRMLVHTSNTITEIAYELNFEDNSYFGRFFKKYSGTTPAKFRSSMKSGEEGSSVRKSS
jgi:AraC family transcriptional regulator, transcriptional activator of pobA